MNLVGINFNSGILDEMEQEYENAKKQATHRYGKKTGKELSSEIGSNNQYGSNWVTLKNEETGETITISPEDYKAGRY